MEVARRVVLGRLAQWYGVVDDEVGDDRPFAELGLTSRDAVALAAEVGDALGERLPSTLLWEAPTLGALAQWLDRDLDLGPVGPAPGPSGVQSPVAVIGIGCRLPGGVTGPAGLWRLLSDGRDAVGTVPDDRWADFAAMGAPDGVSRHGAFLPDVAGFDAEFFGITPHEAAVMDPQQRLLLEVTAESLHHAALPAANLAGTRTGVFVGVSGNEYARLTTAALSAVDAWTPPGAALSIAANRISYVLDLRGPSLAVDTACSSSLVAVHQAVRSLACGESDTALAGGVNLLLSPALTLAFQRAGATAPDGRCKTFDAAADGMVRGEGCAVVVLKRLTDAERDGDRVLAVIRSSAVNSDGRSNGLLAPNGRAQQALLAEAHRDRGPVPPAEVDYVEAHGTGTALGDPVEAGALGAVLGRGRDPDLPLLIGSAKTNFGHLEAAAGIVGLAKTVLALHHGELPPSLHFGTPSPHIDFDALALRVVTGAEPWPRYSGTATAGVSAFGFGGTNAHVVLQEYLPTAPPPRERPDRTPVVAVLDAPSAGRLREDAAAVGEWLDTAAGRAAVPADVARTLAGRTGRGRHRLAVVTADTAELGDVLRRFGAGQPHAPLVAGSGRGRREPGPVWVFSGYGSQWPGMAEGLLTAEPAFAAAVARLDPLLLRHTGRSLRDGLRPDADLSRPSAVQPVLFGVQVALADLWRSYGIEPAAVIGHSMGEVAAAVVAGALDAETGARLIGVRSRLLDGLSGGAMAVVDRSAGDIADLAGELPSLLVAVHASPTQSVVTGADADIAALIARVTAEGGLARSLAVTAAGHSPDVDPLLGPFARESGVIEAAAPRCRFYSTVAYAPRDTPAFDTAYWGANLRRPVRFAQAVRAAAEDGHRVFVEVSPHPTQLHPLTDTLRDAEVTGPLVLPTLRRATPDAVTFRTALATLLTRTPEAARPADRSARVLDIPAPRWHHRRHWVTDAPVPRPPSAEPGVAGEATTVERLLALAADVMGYPESAIDPGIPLTDLGLDSLMAARLLATVTHTFGIALPPAALLNGATLTTTAALLDAAPTTGHAPGPVLPRDAVERLVSQAWTDAGGRDPGGVERELEHTVEIRRRFAELLGERTGREPSTAELGADDGPVTVAGVARLLRPGLEGPVEGGVRVLRATGDLPPLYLFHPAGGSSAVYRGLVQRLPARLPCFGLDRLPGAGDVGERAAVHAESIRRRHPEGPWAVGGWSYGGLLAQETARLLSAHGAVEALLLIDSVLPLPAPPVPPAELARRRFADFAAYVERTYGRPLPLPYDELAALDDDEQIARVVKALEQAVDLPPAVLEHQRTSYLDLRSGERHTPGAYGGRTLLCRATLPAPHTVREPRYERSDEALGWDAHCQDLTVAPLAAHHLALLDPPAVDTLASLLTAYLTATEGATVRTPQ